MRICLAHRVRHRLSVACLTIIPVIGALAQGTITFDAHPWGGGTNYVELGLQFRLIVPGGGASYDEMLIVPPGPGNVPQDSTPFMGWFRQYNLVNYVSLSLTTGSLFGLSSVQLADPNSPSLSPVAIFFVGHLGGGSTTTNTFTTPGNGATTFATYTFNSDFHSGLTSVDILAPRWAMDNLVFTVPEPSTLALVAFGLFGLALRRRRART
jgi:hypothetical protein